MDPMQRLGLEIAYEAFENGKYMVEFQEAWNEN